MYEIQNTNNVSNMMYAAMAAEISSAPYKVLQNDDLTGISFAEDTLRAKLTENKEEVEEVAAEYIVDNVIGALTKENWES